MEILTNWNDDIKITCDINLNDNVIKLLKNVPCHMNDLTYKERYKETINYIIQCFSFILEKNKKYNNIEFANAIKNYYSLDNLKIKYVYDFLMAI